MRKPDRVLTVLVFIIAHTLAVAGGGVAAQPDEAKEPPIQYTLSVGDKSIKLTEGQDVRLEGSFTNPQVSLRAEPYREFSAQGIKFQYPRGFTFEADLSDPASKSWTLSGTSCTLMLFVMNEKITAEEFSQVMIRQFGQQNCRVADPKAELTLGKEKLTGIGLRIKVATTQLSQDIYLISSQPGLSRMMIVQDSLDDQGNPSPDRKTTLEVLAKSFELK